MSSWTYISGQVTVVPAGSGNHAKTFVLNEVLDHLPKVSGSEGPMSWHIVQRHGYDSSCNCDEFGSRTNLSEERWWRTQSTYIVVLEGYLRDTYYEDTLKAFVKWLNRLSKRVWIEDMLVRVSGLKRCYDWGERIFSGAGYWKKNYRLAVESKNDLGLDSRKSTNFRYDLMPDMAFWPDILVNLVPGGKKLAEGWDLLLGNAEPEEYLEWNPKKDDYDGIDPDIFKFVGECWDRVEDVHASLNDGRFWPGADGGDES